MQEQKWSGIKPGLQVRLTRANIKIKTKIIIIIILKTDLYYKFMFLFIISNTISIIKYNNLRAHVLFKFINIYKI
jgi:hypothetical protein